MDASSTTFKEAVCGKKYAKASWICFLLNSFNQQSGIDAIFIYANRLLIQMEESGGDLPLTALQGTYVIGATNVISAILAISFISVVGRRPIFITGELAMCICLFLCGLAILNSWNMTSFIMINLFITAF